MPFDATVYRVLIASPSDLPEERQAATDACHEWNAQHAAAELTVLLPVRWETHAVPEAGRPTQDAVTDQIVRPADILVGMFWTKLGTPTRLAVSGTMEEIEYFINAKRPVILYESTRPIKPDAINMKQYTKLKKEKAKLYKNLDHGQLLYSSRIAKAATASPMGQGARLPRCIAKADTCTCTARCSNHTRSRACAGADAEANAFAKRQPLPI
jgi:hypothetical protein